jgi:predicted Zn-dependent protease
MVSGCTRPAPGPREKGPGPGGREQHLALSPQQELQAGRRAYKEVLEEYRGRILPADDPQVERVRRVMGKIVEAAQIPPLQKEINLTQLIGKYKFEWAANVVREDQINAFCLPAGKIIVFTGLLRFVGDDDDQLAAVMAHEISHALSHHASERVAREQRGGVGVLRQLSYDRAQESEADHIGVFLMTFAGYDPVGALRFWKRMSARAHSGLPSILSDHPSDRRRLEDLRRRVPRARAAKKAYDEGRVV